MELDLVKYHGLGNDFLVLVVGEKPRGGPDGNRRIDRALVRALCDRHHGVGADGVLRVTALGAGRVAMDLYNADGGVAETSGNGLRCAALAAFDEHVVSGTAVVVETLAGVVRAEVSPGPDPGGADVRVEMGLVDVGPELGLAGLPEPDPARWPGQRDAPGESSWDAVLATLAGRRARRVAVGNPHVVLYGVPPRAARDGAASEGAGRGPAGAPRITSVGPALEAAVDGGVNVELVEVGADGSSLVLDVWERGVGVTLACGSGSCAAAAALRAAGLVGDVVEVVNPGGSLVVELSGDPSAASAILTGPARRVGRVRVDAAELLRAAPGGSWSGPMATASRSRL